jgi:Glycosyltransferase family 87
MAAGAVVLVLGCTLLAGLALKAPCASGDWADGRPYTRYCYTDILALYTERGLSQGRVPFLDEPNEYPPLQAGLMWGTALVAHSDGGYLIANAIALSLLAGVVVAALRRRCGDRAVFVAAAPSLALTAFLNWDLLAVALSVVGVTAFLRRRDGMAGAMLGLGAAAKVFPGLLVLPLVAQRIREGDRRSAGRIALWAIAAWLVVNGPVAALSFERWSLFYRFTARRPIDWGTLWYAGCHALTGRVACPAGGYVNAGSWAAFALALAIVWRARARRDPATPLWTLGAPMVALLLLTAKVYSPQYTLWLLPWFALVVDDVRVWLALAACDALVFFAEFSWLGARAGFGGAPTDAMEIAVVARAAVLVWFVVAYARAPISEGAAGFALGPDAEAATRGMDAESRPVTAGSRRT